MPNKRGVKINRGVGISKNPLVSAMNEERDINETKIKRHKCLMLNLKASKQTRSKASKNKVIIKIVSNISVNEVNLSK